LKRGRRGGHFYSLTFSFRFQHMHDTVYFAHCFPYTYSDLCRYLGEIEADPRKGQYMRRRAMCRTVSGNTCDLLTITAFSSDPVSLAVR
ncbi:hypothetical protein KIPB_013392, partial [Kipferlia bialata]